MKHEKKSKETPACQFFNKGFSDNFSLEGF